ncbi:hypothetical protein ACFOZ7_16465 [Natribaculum luteum]|uniref:Uncharacterized protein n=1 Tax=Natribaculum luteum TaxID=1586232 RepID=A0ABD5P2L9_9EURY|nr:hypothetical protein [Natribaculum luteum]
MGQTGRANGTSLLTGLGRAFGTTVGVAWTTILVGVMVARVAGVTAADLESVVPLEVVGAGVLVLAVGLASWLEDGGYERLGADPTGGAQFAWLAFFYLPLAVLPLRVGLGATTAGGPTGVAALSVQLGCVALAVWLSLYGGLDRLGLETRRVGHAALAGVIFGVLTAAITTVLEPSDALVALVALVAQLTALWVAVGGVVDRLRQ